MQGFAFLSPIFVRQIDNQLLLRRGKYRHHFISRDLIWITIVVWNYLQTNSAIILAIWFAIYIHCISIEITIQLNSWIGCFQWSPNPRLKHLLSNHGPRDVIMQQQRHKWLCGVMAVMHGNRCILPMQCAAFSIRQDNLGKYTSSREQIVEN